MENTNIDIIINKDCPCKRTKCVRHGNCKECRQHHLTKNKYLVACDRIKAKELKKQDKQNKVKY